MIYTPSGRPEQKLNFLLFVIVFFMLTACSSESESPQSTQNSRLQIPVHSAIYAIIENLDQLTVRLTENGNTLAEFANLSKQLDAQNPGAETLIGELSVTLPVGEHSLVLEYYINDPGFGLLKIAETSVLVVNVVKNESTDADFFTVNLILLDNDGDGVSDTTEIGKGTDPTDSASLPPPDTPTNVVLEASVGNVRIQWQDVEGAAAYTIFWDITTNVSTSSTQIQNVSNPYNHDGRAASTTYSYRVMASNSAGDSALSATQSATTPAVSIPAGAGKWDESQWDTGTFGD